MNCLWNIYYIFRHFLKPSLHYRVKYKSLNVAIALTILDDKAVLNVHDNFVNC